MAFQVGVEQVDRDRAEQYGEAGVTAIANSLRKLTVVQLSDRDLALVSELDANWDTLGWVYFARGDMAKAEKYVNAAWLLGEHGEVGDHLAQIYEKRGRKDAAINTYAIAKAGIRATLETPGRLAARLGRAANVPAAIVR